MIKPPVAIYSALADASRCRIVEILRTGPKPVHELAEAFAISRPAISRHLRVMKTAGLVVEVKKGRENLYSLRLGKLDKAITWINTLSNSQDAESSTPAEKNVAAKKPVPAVPAAVASDVVPSDAIAPAIARAAAKKPISQMGFDF